MNREEILRKYNHEDKIFAGHIIDKINEYTKKKKTVSTDFLNLREQGIAISILNKVRVPYFIFNHQDLLEKKLIIISNEEVYNSVSTIKITNLEKKELEHKDYMGALYNSGIKDSTIGDIYLIDNYAIVFIIEKIKDYLLYNLTTVGNNQVAVEEINLSEINLLPNFLEETLPVSSLRIDTIIAKHFHLSRSQAITLIKKKNLIINNNIIESSSYQIKENDIVSLRKYGKFKYINSFITKKDKLRITILRYK